LKLFDGIYEEYWLKNLLFDLFHMLSINLERTFLKVNTVQKGFGAQLFLELFKVLSVV